MKRTIFIVLLSLFVAVSPFAQDGDSDEEALPFDFEDPFSTGEEIGDNEDLPFDFEDPLSTGEDSGDNEELPFADTEKDGEETGEGASGSFDSLFDNEVMIEEIDEETADQAPQEDFLTSEALTWGGSFSGTFETSWNWDDITSEELSLTEPDTSALTAAAGASLFFDARPDPDFRVFGKLKIDSDQDNGAFGSLAAIVSGGDITSNLPEGWTAEEDEEGNTVIYDSGGNEIATISAEDGEEEEDESETGSPQVLDISVFELFSDFTWQDSLFIRFGKHTIRWGTGYFWSPADVLNLTAIDTEDPTADREGPVSMKIHVPFSVHNAYLYLIANDGIEPSETAVAPKAEFVLGGTELSLAGYYQAALAPRVIAMATGSLGDFGLFGEAVLSYGSDRVFVRRSRDQSAAEEDTEDDLEVVLDTFTVEDRPFFSATCGFNWLHSFEEPKLGSMMIVGQYFFNGEGYSGSGLLAPAYRLFLNSGENGLAIEDAAARPEGYEDPPALSTSDLANFGRHYAALIFNWSSLFDEDISFSALAIANLSDLSFIVSPNVSFTVFEKIDLTLGARITFGEEGDEYTNPAGLISGDYTGGGTFALTLSGSVGGGSF